MPRPSRTASTTFVIAVVAIVSGCGDRSGKVLDDPVFPPPATVAATVPLVTPAPSTEVAAPFTLVAPWVDGSPLPDRHTCVDVGTSPALTWSNVPGGTVELAVSVVDLDADQFVHWLVYGMSPIESGLAEGQNPGGFEWPNSSGATGWTPPCPPVGETHRYAFTVYALNQQLEAADDAPATEVLSILNTTSIAQSTVSGIASG